MGTEAFWVPAALAAIGGTTQYVNQSAANKRADTSEAQAIRDQEETRQTANSQVRNLTQQIAGNSPAQTAAKSTGEYVSQLRKNAAGSTQGGSTTGGTQTFGQSSSALPPNVGGASSRYGTSLATGQKEAQDFGNTYAEEMGQLDAATRQRQNEGLAMQTLSGGLNTLGLESYGKNFVDQLRSQAAGQANPWFSLVGNILGGAANQTSMNPDAYFKPKKLGPGIIPSGSTPTPQYDGWEGALA